MIASNAFLIGYADESNRPEYHPYFTERRDLWRFGSLGALTPLVGVEVLTPNQSVDLGTFKIRRFYPRENMFEDLTVDAASTEIVTLCRSQVRLLSKRYTLATGLTAGVDSRFSAAISSSVKCDQVFFSYYLNPIRHADPIIAQEIAESLNLRHFILVNSRTAKLDRFCANHSHLVEVKQDDNMLENIKAWDWYRSRPGAASYYSTTLVPLIQVGKPVLHIIPAACE